MKIFFYLFIIFSFFSCSPLKSLPDDERHKMELTLHKVKATSEEIKHDLDCFKTEIEILDKKINYQENAIKKEVLNEVKESQKSLFQRLEGFEEEFSKLLKIYEPLSLKVSKLSNYSNEVSSVLSQHKSKILELENAILAYDRKLENIKEVKEKLEKIASVIEKNVEGNFFSYKIKSGDSLEAISKKYNVKVSELQKINLLKGDLIVVGQELKIPR